MPSTLVPDYSNPLTRDDLRQFQADLERDLKLQTRADLAEVLTQWDVRDQLRKDLRAEVQAILQQRDRVRSNRQSMAICVTLLSLAGAATVAFLTIAITVAALGA